MSDVPEPLPQTLELSAFSGWLSRVGGVELESPPAPVSGLLVRDKCMADGDLADLPAGRLIAADPHLDAAKGHRIGWRCLPLVRVIDDVIGVVIEAVCAFVDRSVAVLVDSVEFVVQAPGIVGSRHGFVGHPACGTGNPHSCR